MLYTKEFVFIHVEKTGGMSLTRFLINALDDPVTVFVPDRGRDHALAMPTTPEAAAKLTCHAGTRHEKPPAALELLEKHGLPVPPFAFAVIRSPVDLMLSYYKHLQKDRVRTRRSANPGGLKPAALMATEVSFDTFARQARFYNMRDRKLMKFYQPDGFPRLDVVPLKRIGDYLTLRFSHHAAFDLAKLEHRNKSKEGQSVSDLDPDTVAHIKATYPKVQALYEEAMARDSW
ncbi:MAG: hypothetical protein WBB85_08170 [Albidovulum sp.]|uniref:hypothetical protein n=1 Tax=Albidovulum sp. TaxID=1872424 RepID=UPI003C89B6C6